MSPDHTQQQTSGEQQRARELSLQRTQPPAEVPGYVPQQFLGSGAYGEVWVGVDQNTGRRVAIKFYTHRGGIDWSLLSREVEKLVFLSADRYVVQLLDVGWDADPPYYVMDYIENGSLEDLLREHGPRSVADAVELFREICVGLMHVHGKGVLHCDLKPANVLLDEDEKPRLADFGQSRLSHEQSPALGTLFYMAPEQADLEALPDARWDVYALGALLYCMLTGEVPHRNEQMIQKLDAATDLADRLARYRQAIQSAPPPHEHHRIRGVDRSLAEIIDRCLAADPRERFPSVQSVFEALRARDEARARRPLQVLGIAGPLLLLLIMALFGWRGYNRAMGDSARLVRTWAEESNRFAAQSAAEQVAGKVDRYFRTVEQVVGDSEFRRLFREAVNNPNLGPMLERLDDPNATGTEVSDLRNAFIEHPDRQALQAYVEMLIDDKRRPEAASWFVGDSRGTQVAAVFDREDTQQTIGKNYSWRTYFHGGPLDARTVVDSGDQPLVRYERPPGDQHISSTHLSAVFESTATNTWKVAISSPIFDDDGKFAGIVALTVEIGNFMKFKNTQNQFAVLVDGREGRNQGVILQHPLFDQLLREHEMLPPRFSSDLKYRVPLEQLEQTSNLPDSLYDDPLAQDELGAAYAQDWIVAKAPVVLDEVRPDGNGPQKSDETGLIVLVQENYATAINPVQQLGRRLVREGLLALAGVILVVFVLWYFVIRMLSEPRGTPRPRPLLRSAATPLHSMETISAPKRLRP